MCLVGMLTFPPSPSSASTFFSFLVISSSSRSVPWSFSLSEAHCAARLSLSAIFRRQDWCEREGKREMKSKWEMKGKWERRGKLGEERWVGKRKVSWKRRNKFDEERKMVRVKVSCERKGDERKSGDRVGGERFSGEKKAPANRRKYGAAECLPGLELPGTTVSNFHYREKRKEKADQTTSQRK